MAANLNTAILNSSHFDSAILHKTLTQTNSIWLKLIHLHSTWWSQPSWILPFWIQPFCTKKTSLIHSDSTWWSQPSWILPCRIEPLPSWIQRPCYLLSDSLRNTLTPLQLWLKLIQSDSNSFILTQLEDVSHLEFCLLDSAILNKKNSLIHCHSTWGWQPSWILPSWIQPFCTKKTSLIHSDSTWWSQPSWILPCRIEPLPSWIQTPCYLLSDSLRNTLTPFWLWLKLSQSDSNSFILT